MRRPPAVDPTPIPILLYHAVCDDPSAGIAPYTVTPEQFWEHLGLFAELGCTVLTTRELVSRLRRGAPLPEQPLVLTFDDAYVDFATNALPPLIEHGFPPSLYVATGLVPGKHRPDDAPVPLGPILDWAGLRELVAAGVEIGGHSHTHPHLDTLPAAAARQEIELCKQLLEDELQLELETFAYPNGYTSRSIRRAVRDAGFAGACAVRNALSSTGDDLFALSRLTIRNTTSLDELRSWVMGRGVRVAPFREQARTRAWRGARRFRAAVTRRPGSDIVTAPARGFERTRVLEVELAAPLPRIERRADGGAPYERALLVASLHGVPVGTVDVDLPPEGLDPDSLAETLGAALGGEIDDHCTRDGIASLAVEDPPCRLEHGRLLELASTVTVAIATRDRHDVLEACLHSLAAAAGTPLEVVVVDNAPTRPAAELVARLGSETGLELRYELEPVPGLAVAHNRALAVARGEIVAFIDDDVVVQPVWLPELLRAFEIGDDVACVTGAIVPIELETAPQGWLEQFGGFAKGFRQQVFDAASAGGRGPLYPYAAGTFGSGANMAFRTNVLRALGGFDPAIGAGTPARGGDDLAAFLAVVAAGHTLVYQPTALVYHRHRRDYEGLRRTTFGYGVGLTAYLTKALLDDPARVLELARKAPHGLAHGLGSSSPKHRKKLPDYPRELTRRERYGMVVGPAAYLWSRSRRRRLALPPQGWAE